MMSILERFGYPAYKDLGPPETIEPIFGTEKPTLEAWERVRGELKARWAAMMGRPSYRDYERKTEALKTFEQPTYTGTLFRQTTGPDHWQRLLLMEPKAPLPTPRPGMVVPFYNPDRSVGLDLGSPRNEDRHPLIEFGCHLVEQGYSVVCTEAFPYNTVPRPDSNIWSAWWEAGAEKLRSDHPHWTGIGKLTADTIRAVDLLLGQPEVDPNRIGVMGHSLGGKMAFYAGCLDERLKAIVCSDFGIGWTFTNWEYPWYHGKQVLEEGFPLGHHQLLAMAAPKPFFLFGGEADRPASWQYLNEARKVYALYGRQEAIGFFDHASGHRPTRESLKVAYTWLRAVFTVEGIEWTGV